MMTLWLMWRGFEPLDGSSGVKVESSDFIRTRKDSKRFITTELLPKFIQQWMNGKRRGGTWDNAESAQRAELDRMLGRKSRDNVFASPVELLLGEHHRYVWRYCGKGAV